MELCTNELQQKRTNLRRAPPPKAPVPEPNDKTPELFAIRLKPTKLLPAVEHNKDKPAETNECDDNVNNNGVEAKGSTIKRLSKSFENGSPGKPPVLGKPPVTAKKPAAGSKPPVPGKPVNGSSKQNTEIVRARPPSVINKPSPTIVTSVNNNGQVPELRPLPPQSVLGDPPEKPPKFGALKPSLKKYVGTSYPPRPVPKTSSGNSGNGRVSAPAVDDAPPIPKKPLKPEKKQNEDGKNHAATTSIHESETEDFYDDTACSTSVDNAEDFYDDTACTDSNAPAPSEDFYDDTACTGEFAANDQAESFGEELYEPILANQQPPKKPPAEAPPPTPPSKDHGKDDKKKKEKERKKKEKEEKEEKEREEKEKKKREKEREKKNSEMKRRFSVKGNEKSIGKCCAAEDIPGNRMDIAASIGDEFDIIRKGKPNPNNKWLVRNKQGQYGFIDIDKIEKEPADEDEDLYEEVPASRIRNQISNGNGIPSPPVTSPPPPPTQSAPKPSTAEQDIYDDVAGQDNNEELYELLPEN